MGAPLVAHSWDVCEYDIERLCVYITDDAAVANYFGIPRERVEHVRKKMGNRVRYLRTGQDVLSDTAINASTQKAEAAAQEGSAQLLERTNMMFRKFAKKHCMGVDDALVVQQFGWNVWHRLRAQA